MGDSIPFSLSWLLIIFFMLLKIPHCFPICSLHSTVPPRMARSSSCSPPRLFLFECQCPTNAVTIVIPWIHSASLLRDFAHSVSSAWISSLLSSSEILLCTLKKSFNQSIAYTALLFRRQMEDKAWVSLPPESFRTKIISLKNSLWASWQQRDSIKPSFFFFSS